MNNLCYRYEKLSNNSSLFPIIDCSYVLIMNGSKFESRVRRQLKEYPLSIKMILQWNSGFKKCEKRLARQFTVSDLTDCYATVFHNALENGYNYIIILEEDFMIDERIRDNEVREDINRFILGNNPEMICLGSVIWKSEKCEDNNFRRLKIKQGTHAVIMNRKIIEYLYRKINDNEIYDMDILTNKDCERMYGYKYPLIKQVFSITENQENWGSNIKSEWKRKILLCSFLFLLRLLGFNSEKSINNAYNINYKIHFDDRLIIIKLISNYLSEIFNNIT